MDKSILNQKAKSSKSNEHQALDQKLAKIKEALKGVNWNYGSLFEDLNGFIEGHEENNLKLKKIEAERQKMIVELQKSDQRIQLLNKKLEENQGELNYVKRGYQHRVDELLKIKNELQGKLEETNQINQINSERIQTLVEDIKRKEQDITKNKAFMGQAEEQVSILNKNFADKVQKIKLQVAAKFEEKDKLAGAKINRINSEKDQLQKYVTELMTENTKNNNDMQQFKRLLSELNLQKEDLIRQKNEWAKKEEKNENYVQQILTTISTLENKIKNLNQSEVDKDEKIKNLKIYVEDQKTSLQHYEEQKNIASKIMADLNKNLNEKNSTISSLNLQINELKKMGVELESIKMNYQISALENQKLNKQLFKFNEELNQLKIERKKTSELLKANASEINYLNLENKSWTERYDALVHEYETNIEAIKLQKSELQEMFDDISKELRDSKSFIELKSLEMENQTKKIFEISKDLDFSKENIIFLEKELATNTQLKNELEEKLNFADQNLHGLKRRLGKKDIEIEELNQSIEKLKIVEVKFFETSKELELEKNQKLELLEKINSNENRILNLEKQNESLSLEKSEVEKNLKETKISLSHELEQVKKSSKDQIDSNNELFKVKVEELKTAQNLKFTSLVNDFEGQIEQLNRSQKRTHEILLQKTFEIENLLKNIDLLETNEDVLAKKADDLSLQIQELQENVLKHEEKEVELQDEISALNIEKNKIELTIIDNKQIINDLEIKIEEITSKLDDEKEVVGQLKTELKFKDNVIFEKDGSINELNERVLELEEMREALVANIDRLKFEVSEREAEVVQKQKIVDDNFVERKNFLLKIEMLNEEVSDLNSQLNTSNSNLRSANERSEARENEVKEEQIQYKKTISGFEHETENLKFEKMQLTDLSKQLEYQLTEQKQENSNLTEEITVLKSMISQLENENSISLSVITEKSQNENELAEKIKVLSANASDLSFKLVQAGEQFDSVYKQKQTLEIQAEENKELYAKVKLKNKELESVRLSIIKRDEQLNLYSRWVDSQKEGLQKQVLKIVSELRTTKDLNPLNPYLKITEREISKIEVLMTKSNVFGPQRAHLENQYEQLVKQRDEVKELLLKTDVDVDNKVQAMMSVLKSSEFIPVPPLPPGKIEKSETEISG